MSFNAETYRANKHRKSAWANIAQARDIKDRAARGEAYDWEMPRIASFVKLARIDLRMAHSIERGQGRRPVLARERTI